MSNQDNTRADRQDSGRPDMGQRRQPQEQNATGLRDDKKAGARNKSGQQQDSAPGGQKGQSDTHPNIRH